MSRTRSGHVYNRKVPVTFSVAQARLLQFVLDEVLGGGLLYAKDAKVARRIRDMLDERVAAEVGSKPQEEPTMSKIVKAESAAELQEIASKARGPVVLEFKSDDCGACIEEQPKVEALASKCADATVIQVDVDKCGDVADAWGIEAMPTLFVAQKGSDLQPGKAREVEDSAAAAKLLKCPR